VKQLELHVLYDISKVIGNALNLDHTLESILAILSDYLCMKRATITLKNDDEGTLQIRASHGLLPNEKRRGVYRLDEGVTGLVFRTAKPFVVPDVSKEPLFLNKTGARNIEKGRISFVGVPIILNRRPLGVLSVDRLFGEEISFEEDIRFLTILATLVGQLVSLNRQVKVREENLLKANRSLKTELSEKSESFFKVGSSLVMSEVQRLIRKVAPTKATVLLLGESGTGKTLVAKIIHELSERARAPFVKVNCAGFPESLLESELFGYEKGAFTGAVESKSGRMEEADGGTVFLDEVGELPLTLQGKLLRFLQEREFERLGSTKTRKVDVRIIAATNRDLSHAAAVGTFRQDLYYRLNVFPVRMPSLRERGDDVISLVNFFCRNIRREYGCSLRFSESALNALKNYSWPGNVREMENLIERFAIIFGEAEIRLPDLAPYLARSDQDPQPTGVRQGSTLMEREKHVILQAMERNNWNQSKTAQDLGITLRQVGYRLRKFGLYDLIKSRKHRRPDNDC
jgi:Nif-specific regulatory protein